MKLSPQPRFRIYSDLSKYAKIFSSILLGHYDYGNYVSELESLIQSYLGVSYAVALPQARVGIYLTIKSIITPSKKEVILSPYTIADVVNMVICAGGIPVFADVDRNTCNITLQTVAPLINKNTAVVLTTHLHGLMSETIELKKLCEAHSILLIEDAAQSWGASLEGCQSGTIGDVGIYSFGRYKHINSFWGGMLVTNNERIATECRKDIEEYSVTPVSFYAKRVFRALMMQIATSRFIFPVAMFHFFKLAKLNNITTINRLVETELDENKKADYPNKYKVRMSSLQANVVTDGLNNIANDNKTRISYATIYHNGLSTLQKYILPPLKTDCSHIYTCYPLQVDNREQFILKMLKSNRDVVKQHIKNCADLPAFSDWKRDCPNARACANSVVMMPTYPSYGTIEVLKNIEVLQLL